MRCYVTLSNVSDQVIVYKDVITLFTTKKAGHAVIRYVLFYCVFSNSLYCRVCLFISWGSNFREFR